MSDILSVTNSFAKLKLGQNTAKLVQYGERQDFIKLANNLASWILLEKSSGPGRETRSMIFVSAFYLSSTSKLKKISTSNHKVLQLFPPMNTDAQSVSQHLEKMPNKLVN